MFGLGKTLSKLFTRQKCDDQWFEDLEESLLLGDVGIPATQVLLEQLKKSAKEQGVDSVDELRQLLKLHIESLLKPLEHPHNPLLSDINHKPIVLLVVGVNGAGKTTSIGKLCHHFQKRGLSVLLGAGDTFRAAAKDQLKVWGERNQVTVITQDGGDAAAVAHDAVKAGMARGSDVVIIDTAGRLSTQNHLMDELKKVKKVIGKALDGAPHETILVIDGNTGQNALMQVKAFDQALELNSLVITKLDGTAKGGVLCAIAQEFHSKPIHVLALGLGEQMADLKPFYAPQFAELLLPKQ